MDAYDPAIDLILGPAGTRETCAVCERTPTDILCHSCEPEHHLCRNCVPGHRDDFNHVLGRTR
jgi:hypothetical protein